MGGSMHKLQRAREDMSLGIITRSRERREQDLEVAMIEHEQQIRIALEGAPSPGWGFGEVEVEFDHHFFYAPAQRDSDLIYPHFTFGSFCEEDAVVVARVKEWDIREHNGAIRGATVGVAIQCKVAYEGYLDLRFQGYAALDEIESQDLET